MATNGSTATNLALRRPSALATCRRVTLMRSLLPEEVLVLSRF